MIVTQTVDEGSRLLGLCRMRVGGSRMHNVRLGPPWPPWHHAGWESPHAGSHTGNPDESNQVPELGSLQRETAKINVQSQWRLIAETCALGVGRFKGPFM